MWLSLEEEKKEQKNKKRRKHPSQSYIESAAALSNKILKMAEQSSIDFCISVRNVPANHVESATTLSTALTTPITLPRSYCTCRVTIWMKKHRIRDGLC